MVTRMVKLRANWPVLAGLAAVVVGVVVGLIALGVGTSSEQQPPQQTRGGVVATATVSPHTLQFGDRLTARFDIAVDRRYVDPARVRLSAAFAPLRIIGRTRITRRTEGDVSLTTYAVTLGCDTNACLPDAIGARREFALPDARVSFRRRSSLGSFADHVSVALPRIGVASRLSVDEIQDMREANPLRVAGAGDGALTLQDVTSLWRDGAENVADVSYWISPTLLAGLLLGLAALLAALAVRLVLGTLQPAPVVADLEPAPVALEPLDHALRELELSLSNGHVDQQRRALELLANELGRTSAAPLARQARRLAWSAGDPDKAEAQALVENVRGALSPRSDEQLA